QGFGLLRLSDSWQRLVRSYLARCTLTAIMEWISVKERLPEKKGMRVLVVGDRWNNPYITIGEWGNDEWDIDRLDRLCGLSAEKVTHGMPLPEPPAREEPSMT